ncbi:hypothetical protein Celaphus_00008314 [Cervus elaphus hippelaphus]|uniref:Uncharacterized protein n=1 Tax=Cervus elaphus hippelaphus TaxID=46360 RepID=A0A212CPC9_CEREH|nr:hypothetical protein Celaphus_00008314 [Cervus elaphus hippelaphus]
MVKRVEVRGFLSLHQASAESLSTKHIGTHSLSCSRVNHSVRREWLTYQASIEEDHPSLWLWAMKLGLSYENGKGSKFETDT